MLRTPLDVVCLGILVVDVIARPVEGLPARGTLELVDEISMRGGGSALNTASALVRLGLHAGAGLVYGLGALVNSMILLFPVCVFLTLLLRRHWKSAGRPGERAETASESVRGASGSFARRCREVRA